MQSQPAPLIRKKPFRSVRNVLFAALLFGGMPLLAQQPNITASQTDAFPSHPDNRAREGDTITYTTTISNAAGTADATGVQLANPTPLNTTDVAGSIQVSPLGFPDSYPAGENMALTVVAPGVLGNDTGIPAPSAVPIAAGPTTQGGTITLNANGSFTYTPATNFTGTDTFTYTVTNIQPPNDTATVTLTVIPPPVANPDGYNTVKNIALSIVAPGVLGNDTTNGAPIVSYGIIGNEQTIIGSPTATAQAGSVSLNADGSLSYTPPVDFTGSDTFNYTLSNIGGNSIATVTFTVTCQAITLTNPTNATGAANAAFSETFTQTGGTGTTTFALNSGTLPAGLLLSAAGVLSGTPTQTGSFPITVKATDSTGCVGIGPTYPLAIGCQTINVINPGTTTGTVDAAFSQAFTQTGAIGTTTFTLNSGTLPSGLTLAADGTLSGTPGEPGSFPITVKVTDANGCTGIGATYTLVIACQTITVTNPTTSTGTVDAAFSQTFTQTGVGTHTPATFTLNSGTLPSGLTLAADGTLSGTPGAPGSFPITVKVTDANGCTGIGSTYTLVIACQTITVTNPTTSTGTVDAAFSQTFTQTGVGTHTPATFSLNSGTLPTGLTLAANGTLSGTPGQSGSFPITVKVTDVNGCTGIGSTYTLVIACQTITVTNPTTSTGSVDALFSQTFTQTGVGTHTPATFTLNSGTLPSGLTLAANGTLSGTPGAPGSFPITVKVTDANGCTGIGSTYTLVIACQTITVTNPATSTGSVDALFSQTFTQTGVGTHTPATFTLNSGTLPGGLTLAANGTLSGTPTAPGSFPMTVKVTDANGCTGIGSTYTLVIACQTITVTNPGTTTGTVDAAFSQTFTQSGVGTHTPATFTLNSGTLPSGLTLAANGTLSGTPGAPGSFPITVKVTDSNGCIGIGGTYTLVIACQTITVINPTTNTGTVDTAFSQTFTQAGVGTHTPATFTLNSGTLPSGLTLGANGTLSGTPGQAGSFPITIKVTDANGCTGIGSTYTLTIACQTITVTNPTTTTGTVDAAFSQTFTQTGVGTHTPAVFTVNTGTLPSGLTLSSAGVLSGTPGQAGSFPITVKVTDANGCFGISATYNLTIACQTITVTNPATTTGTVGMAFSQQFTQTGAHGTATFTTASTLPTGFTLATDGTLSGTTNQHATFPIIVTVTDSNGCTGTSATYNLVINCQTITVTNPVTSTGTVDAAFNQTFTQTGAVGTATFTLNSGTLPAGFTLATNGTLSGTPGQPGSFPITVKVTDSNGCTGIGSTYTLVIACQTITVTNPVTSTGTVDAAFSQTFTQTGVGTHTPATFTLNSGTLPSGLTLAVNGTLSGTPGQPGSFPITVKVTDANGCTGIGSTYTLVIACQTITVTNPAVTTGTVDAAFSQTFTQTGVGTHTPATFTLNSGSLPSGLSLSTAGVLSGTPGQPGSFPITVKVTDANGCIGTGATYTLVIACQTITVTKPVTTVGTYSTAFSQTFTQTGVGTHTPATFTTASTLPTGLSLSTSGVLSGTPTQTGNFPVVVTVTDANGCTGTSSSYALSIVPNLVAETYSDVGNTQLAGGVAAPTTPSVSVVGVGSNDTSDTTITYALSSGPSQGAVTVNSDGTFLYMPAVGNNTTAIFVYSGTSNGATATQTATINFSNKVWYVNSSGMNGDGRSNAPFNSMTGAGTASGANDYVFVHSGGATTLGSITLAAGQTLWGQGSTFTLGPLTIAASTKPTLTGTVTLGGNNDTVSSLDISTGGSTGITNSGTITGALVENSVTVTTTTGTGVSFLNIAGTLSFTGLTTSGGTGTSLTGSNGSATFNFSNVVISSGANAGFTAAGGGTVNIMGAANTITSTTGTALNVANTTIGASGLTFRSINAGSGTSAGSGPATGILLNNTGTTGGLTVTGTGSAGTGGTIKNATGADAATIVPAATENAGSGIFLYNTKGISLSWMQLNDFQNYAIYGNNVTNFTMANCVINGSSGNNDTKDEGTIAFDNLIGTGSITNSNISGGWEDNLRLRNSSGTLNRLTIDTVTWGSNSASFGNAALNMQVTSGSPTMNVTVNNCIFTGSRSHFVSYLLNGSGAPIGDFVFTGNTITQSMTSIAGAGGVFVSGGATTSPAFTFNIQNNIIHSGTQTITGNDINVSHLFGGTSNGTIDGNTIGTTGVVGSGSTQGSGIALIQVGGGTYTVHVTNNTVRRYNDRGIFLQVGDNTTGGNGTVNATLTGNIVAEPDSFALHGLHLNIGTTAGDSMFVCATIGGAGALKNTLTGSGKDGVGGGNGGFEIRSQQRFLTTIRLPGYGGANNDNSAVATFLAGQNTTSGAAAISPSNNVVGGAPGYVNGAACPLLVAEGGVLQLSFMHPLRALDRYQFSTKASVGDEAPVNNHPPVVAQHLGQQFDSIVAAAPAEIPTAAVSTLRVAPTSQSGLLKADLDSIVANAIARWKATGLATEQVAILRKLHFEVTALSNLRLGEASGNDIHVSSNAGGNGWFIDAKAESDALFAKKISSTRSYTDPASAPAGRIDLLTAIMHEMGHALGLNDSYLEQDRDSLMYGYLTKGERRVPAKGEATGAKPSVRSKPQFLEAVPAPAVAPVAIGTIPQGKSVTVTFKVNINNPVPSGTTQISSQGTVSGSNFASVLTDDPDVGGANDPTVTPLAVPPRMYSAQTPPASGAVNVPYGPYTFVADGNPAPAFAVQTGSLPSGLSLSAAGMLNGTPTASGTFSGIVVRATNTAGFFDTNPFTITITAPTPTPTPIPTATPSATATPGGTPTPTPVGNPTPTPGVTPTPTPGGTPGPTPTPATHAINLSTRMRVQVGSNVGIGGFIVTGSVPKRVIIRAIGPSLEHYGVPDVLADPVLELHGPSGFVTVINDNWRDTQEMEIQNTGIPPTNDLESAIVAVLNPGAYTAIVRGKNNTSGVALIEVYDLDQGVDAKLANLSTRALVSTGDDIVIAGFLLSDETTNDRVIVRGVGPSLAPGTFPASAVLANPTLELRDANGALIRSNNDWQDNASQAALITAAGLALTNSLESGIAETLPPGLYTALLAGLNNGTGIGLVEVYDLGP